MSVKYWVRGSVGKTDEWQWSSAVPAHVMPWISRAIASARDIWGKEHHNGGTPMAKRILVVDDDLQILPLLQRGLAYEGFEVYTAVDGESGLVAAKQHQPHLVLLDIASPGLDVF